MKFYFQNVSILSGHAAICLYVVLLFHGGLRADAQCGENGACPLVQRRTLPVHLGECPPSPPGTESQIPRNQQPSEVSKFSKSPTLLLPGALHTIWILWPHIVESIWKGPCCFQITKITFFPLWFHSSVLRWRKHTFPIKGNHSPGPDYLSRDIWLHSLIRLSQQMQIPFISSSPACWTHSSPTSGTTALVWSGTSWYHSLCFLPLPNSQACSVKLHFS